MSPLQQMMDDHLGFHLLVRPERWVLRNRRQCTPTMVRLAERVVEATRQCDIKDARDRLRDLEGTS